MTEHLVALKTRLAHEIEYKARATKNSEIELRTVWIKQIENEIAAEIVFLAKKGVIIETSEENEMSDDELLAALEM